jgi:hypothetical protein
MMAQQILKEQLEKQQTDADNGNNSGVEPKKSTTP